MESRKKSNKMGPVDERWFVESGLYFVQHISTLLFHVACLLDGVVRVIKVGSSNYAATSRCQKKKNYIAIVLEK